VFEGKLVLALDIVTVELELQDELYHLPLVAAVEPSYFIQLTLQLERQFFESAETLADFHLQNADYSFNDLHQQGKISLIQAQGLGPFIFLPLLV
jgi:hypothetical protein